MMTHIAYLDLADFRNGTEAARQAFVQSLGDSFANVGFAAVGNTDINPSLQEALYQQLGAFFALPTATKLGYVVDAKHGQRGYNALGSETAKDAQHHDLKEFWHHGETQVRDADGTVMTAADFCQCYGAGTPQFHPHA